MHGQKAATPYNTAHYSKVGGIPTIHPDTVVLMERTKEYAVMIIKNFHLCNRNSML